MDSWKQTDLKTAGFTLVEILVASSIMVVMTGMILGIAANVIGVWERTAGGLSTSNQAQLAMDLMGSDLEGAFLHEDGRTWLQVDWEAGMGAESLQSAGSAHLMFFSSGDVDGRDGETDSLCAVSYRVGFRDPFQNAAQGDHRRYGLYRAVIDPRNTFRHAMPEDSPANLKTRIWDSAQATPWEDLAGDGRGLSPRAWSLDVANLLASHVPVMEVVLHYRDGTGRPQEVDVSATGSQSVRLGRTLEVDGQVLDYDRLVSVEMRLSILSETGAEIVAFETDRLPANDRGLSLEEIQVRHGEIYTLRIAFMGGSL